MKKMTGLLVLALTAPSVSAIAQEHYTEGPVWVVSYYRVGDDQFENYMKYLRANVLPQDEEAKKQGLVLENKVLLKLPDGPDDWDVAFATLYRNAAEALDYSKDRDEKGKAISEKHYKTADEDKQREVGRPRLAMRRYLGTRVLREVTLKPLTK